MLMKIGDIADKFGISHRSLRYWEEAGIVKSSRTENGYRYYDEENQQKISRILILRKLRLPLKQIMMVLESDNALEIIDSFQQKLNEVDDEIAALSTIRSILESFIKRLNENMMIDLKVNLLDDNTILEISDSLTLSKPALKEEKTSEDLAKANEKLSKLTDRDARIVYLPPMTVAAFHSIGSEAEKDGADPIRDFIEDNNLFEVFPQARHFGFNHPNGKLPDMSDHGYERWISIPDSMEVSAPFVKKHFEGGLYAAHMIPMGEFEEWNSLMEWGNTNDKYKPNLTQDDGECMYGLLEEHLNLKNMYRLSGDDQNYQIDLLMPIREKR